MKNLRFNRNSDLTIVYVLISSVFPDIKSYLLFVYRLTVKKSGNSLTIEKKI